MHCVPKSTMPLTIEIESGCVRKVNHPRLSNRIWASRRVSVSYFNSVKIAFGDSVRKHGLGNG